jgi:hypothetical protein
LELSPKTSKCNHRSPINGYGVPKSGRPCDEMGTRFGPKRWHVRLWEGFNVPDPTCQLFGLAGPAGNANSMRQKHQKFIKCDEMDPPCAATKTIDFIGWADEGPHNSTVKTKLWYQRGSNKDVRGLKRSSGWS